VLEDFERRDQSKLIRFDALALREGPNEVAMSEAPMMLIAANYVACWLRASSIGHQFLGFLLWIVLFVMCHPDVAII
jgi:hypothetical protein